MQIWSKLGVVVSAVMSVACSVTPPSDVKVINNFELNRYLGTWYEVARLDHSFENGLEQVTANYSLRTDGGVKVINRGFNSKKQKWQESEGKAYFTGPASRAALKVSFFGPFYGGYNVIELDKDYQYALICGPNKSYLWILSRTPTLSDDVKHKLLDTAQQYGFDINQLTWVKQSK
ncbi:outer membrane lipoprotein Blc [Enterobacterales bacterium]|nr:outer membrane lipoprotein Blc [Enterobacterales bacterium]